eukprot:1150510-Amphidinium_carterae.1
MKGPLSINHISQSSGPPETPPKIGPPKKEAKQIAQNIVPPKAQQSGNLGEASAVQFLCLFGVSQREPGNDFGTSSRRHSAGCQ